MTEPLARLAALIEEARARGMREPEAMTLATASAAGRPSARLVLCRGIDDRSLRFYTNYESQKGVDLAENPYAAAVFFWPDLDVQVRVEGSVTRLSAADSDAYFEKRPRGHRLAALVSAQSRPIDGIDALRERARVVTAEHEGRPVVRPAYWGGYRLEAQSVEFWTRGADRLHERVRFERSGEAAQRAAPWSSVRLAP